MNKKINILTQVFSYIRKDVGINNSAEAMEQLSLLLLTKYIYERTPKPQFYNSNSNTAIFSNLFSNYRKRKSPAQANFTILNNLFKDFELENRNSKLVPWEVIEPIYRSIPLKVRSEKIFDVCIDLMNSVDVFSDQLAEEYDSLLDKMAEESISSGAHLSPKALINTIVKVIAPKSNQSIYDPAMGTGRVLIEVLKRQYHDINEKNTKLGRLVGNDNSPFALLLGVVNIALNQGDLADLHLKDSLLINDDVTYDIIVSGVPFGKSNVIQNIEYTNFGHATALESMFLKHAMDKLAEGGRAALIVPVGILFNSSREFVELREQLFYNFNFHTILSLPNGVLAPSANLKVCVIFFDKTSKRDDIWYYELNSEIRFSKRNRVSMEMLEEFGEDFGQKKENSHSFYVSRSSILESEGFNISRFVHTNSITSLPKHIEESKVEAREIANELNTTLDYFLNSLPIPQPTKMVRKLSLKEIFKPRSGKALNISEIADSGAYPVYGANGIVGYYAESNRTGENLIMGRVGANCGNIHYVNVDFWLTHNSFSLEILDESIVHMRFLAHLLKSMNLNKYARGAAQPFLSFDKIKDIEVSLPNYEDQARLCEQFDNVEKRAEEIQRLLSKQNTTIKDLKDVSLKNSTLGND